MAELSGVLLAHVGAFEEICQLPLLRAVPGGGPSLGDIVAQKLDICEAVAEAGLQPAGSTQWWLAVRAANAAVDEHVRTVEAGPLKRFAKQASASTRRELGHQWKRYLADFSDDHRGSVRLAARFLKRSYHDILIRLVVYQPRCEVVQAASTPLGRRSARSCPRARRTDGGDTDRP